MTTENRFVFDTNVLVSAFLLRQSTARRTLDLAMEMGQIVCSDETLLELKTVLERHKFDRYLPLADRIALYRAFEKISVAQSVSFHIALCRDPKDDKFLSLALAAQATCIVSGDEDLLVLAEAFEVPILRPADFLLRFLKKNF